MSTKASFDRANPNTLADLLRKVGIGQLLRGQIPQQLRKKNPAADAAQLATVEQVGLANDAKASSILRAYARATSAAGTLGALTVVAPGTTPGDGEIAVAPNGDIVTLAASAYTDVDVAYVPERGDVVVVEELAVAANVLTIPARLTTKGVVLLLDANATEAGATGRKIVLVPGAGAPAAGQARLNLAKSTVTFAGADAVTKAVVTLLVVAAKDLDALLEADEDTI